jgi:hypothetical protein
VIAFRLAPKSGEGRGVVVLGIDASNVEKLKQGLPINVPGQDLDVDVDLAIVYGERMQDIVDELGHTGLDVPLEVLDVAKTFDGMRGDE